jgi:hypothetical protein
VLAVDGELFLEGPGGNEDGVAVVGGVDGGLNRHAGEDVEAVGELKHLDPGQGVAAVGSRNRAR